MRVKCIKIICAYWGTSFSKGKWYYIYKTSNRTLDVITDYDKYISVLSQYLNTPYVDFAFNMSLEKRRELKQINEDYENRENYIKKVDVPFYEIENNGGDIGFFCALSRNDVKMMYGSDKFITSVDYFEDYFTTQSDIRNEIINVILQNDNNSN